MTGDALPSAPYRHLCWSYDDPTVFEARAREFLLGGLAAGERVWYVGAEEPRTLLERLRGVAGLDEAIRRGAVRVTPIDSAYAGGAVFEPAAQVAAWTVATEEALAAGHTGLRVVAEATALVRTPAQRDAFARYEHLVDRYMRVRPMSAMCAYDRRALGDRAVAELACMHPETNTDAVLFRLHAGGAGADRVSLAGELDPSNHELFSTALERADLRPVDGRLVVDAAGLRFVDHRCLIHLQRYAERRGATAVLRTALSSVARLVEMLDLSRVRVEVAR